MSTPSCIRRAVRTGVVVAAATTTVVATPAVAATPNSWNDPAPMSTLQALLIFAGIPLALIFLITLLVMAPSLVRGDRQQRGVDSWTQPQWFGGPGEPLTEGRHADRGQIGSGASGRTEESAGGASARW